MNARLMIRIRAGTMLLALVAAPAWSQLSCPVTGGNPWSCIDSTASMSASTTSTAAGNPVDVTSGNKYQYERDLVYPGDLAVGFSRHYNSAAKGGAVLGTGWTHEFETTLAREQRGPAATIRIHQADGRVLEFHAQVAAAGESTVYRANSADFGVVEEDAPALEQLRRIVGKRTKAVEQTDPAAVRPWVWRWADGRRLSFDGQGRLRGLAERNGARLDLDYDQSGRLGSLRDDAGRSLTFGYWDDTTSLLASYGAQRREIEGFRGRLKSIAVPEGGAVTFGYDAQGLLTAVRHPDGRLRRYEYAEAAGAPRLARIFSGDELVGEYAYDDRGRANYSAGNGEKLRIDFGKTSPQALTGETRVTNTQGAETLYRWRFLSATGQRQIVESRGPGCAVCPPGDRRYSFDARGNLFAIESPTPLGARVETSRFDALGRLVARVEQIGTGEPRVIERLEYASSDPHALPSAVERPSVVTGKVRRLSFQYDADGRLVRALERGFAPTLESSSSHARTDAVEISRETTLRHERKGNRIVVAAIDGPLPGPVDVVNFDWDERGIHLVRVRRPLGVNESWKFDAITGRLLAETPVDGVTIEYGYDARGLLVSRKRAGAVVTLRHDAHGRPDKFELPDGEILRVAYGGPGSSVAMLSNRGVARWVRPPTLQAVANPEPSRPAPPLAQVEPDHGAWGRTSLMVDDFGRTVAMTTGSTGQERYFYDAADRLVERRFADGTVWTYERDALGRITRHRSASDSAQARDTRMKYEGAALASLTESRESVRNARDDRGRVAARTVTRVLPDGRELRYSEGFRYDDADRLVEHRLPEGGRLAYGWGVGTSLTSITYWNEIGVATKLLVGDSRRGFSYGNGVTYSGTLGADGRLEAYQYVAPVETTTANRGWSLFREARAAGLGRVLFSAQLEFGETGKLLTRTDNGDRTAFAYDALGRLIVAARDDRTEHQFYAYGTAGGLLGRNVDGVTRHFDEDAVRRDAGGLPNRMPSMFGDRALRYSADRRLAEVRAGDRVVARYAHNTFGERIAKTVYAAAGGSATTSFFWLNNRLAGESSAGSPERISRRYVYAHDVLVAVLDYDEPRELDRQPEAGESDGVFGWMGARLHGAWAATFGDEPRVTYLHTNEIGTPIGATDAGGRVVWQPEYLAYGAIRAFHQPAPAAGVPRFTLNLRLPGQYYDAETGWHDNYLRTYDPARGQYLEPDPLGPVPNLRSGRELTQPYAYVNHDPLLSADPLGLILFPFDGTANDRNDRTNVLHFATHYDSFNDFDRAAGITGMTYYVNGVQTRGGLADNGVTGGAFAFQLRERVNRGLNFLQSYLDLYVAWEEVRRSQGGLPRRGAGQPLVIDIDTVGFSRGAATAREFINGVVDRIDNGYYGRRYQGCVRLNLRMMALFETVLSTNTGDWWGNERFRMVIPDQVAYVAHAVAMNEHRSSFPVELINPSNAAIGHSSDFRANRVERGFIGAHSDIGGGYNGDASSGESYDGGDLSDVALNWMVAQARAAGVQMRPLSVDLRTISNPIVHDPRRARLWTNLLQRNTDRDIRFRGVDRNNTESMAWSHGRDIELYAGMSNALANTFIQSRNLGNFWASEYYDTRVGDVRICDYLRWLDQHYGGFGGTCH